MPRFDLAERKRRLEAALRLLNSAEAERILMRHASAVTGAELDAVPLDA